MADSDISDHLSECSETSYMSDIEEDNNFVHFNVNSILAPDRIDLLTDVCRTLNINVLILSESKLDQNIPNNLTIKT